MHLFLYFRVIKNNSHYFISRRYASPKPMRSLEESYCTKEIMIEEDLRERFQALRSQESTTYKNYDYLSRIRENLGKEGKKTVDQICRFKMSTWCFDVAECFNYSEETVAIATSYLDKFLSSRQGNYVLHDTRWFQLTVICALHIAIKSNESNNIDTDYLVQLSNGRYTKEHIVSMEREILNALSWRLCPPTSYVFLDFIINNLFPSTISNETRNSIMNIARKQIYLAIPNYCFSTFDPSLVAFASIFNALEEVNDLPEDIQEKFYVNLAIITGFDSSVQNDDNFLSVKIGLRKLMVGHSFNKDTSKRISSLVEEEQQGCFSNSPKSVNTYLA